MKQMVPLLGDEWVLAQRPPRNRVSAERAYAALVEYEPAAGGRLAEVSTIFLTNRECPFRCVMCDLWKNTLEESVRPGQIPGQIRAALEALTSAQTSPPHQQGLFLPHHLKLYNAGSFFDARAIPPEDYPEIARLAARFDRVIVECHPRLVGRGCGEFHELLQSAALRSADSASRPTGEGLEVAMGLETAHPEVLARLNKHMTLDDFAAAARRLRSENIAVRAFIMVRPPFLSEDEGLLWTKRSLDFAFANGVECCSLIPTRGGNGAMEELARRGDFTPPSLDSLEAVLEYGLSLRAGRVFLDLWDIDTISPSAPDHAERIARLGRMNLSQKGSPTRQQG
jgi:archaeosine synthase beta-subunit